MKVLLTGATGFIGARVLRVLEERGHEVAALVTPGHSLKRLEGHARLRKIEGALESIESARAGIEAFAPEGCVHLAWYAEPGKYLPSPRNLDCLAGSIALLRLLERVGCRRVVAAGTCFEYAPQAALMREDGPTKPETLYAACKLSLGLIGQQMAALGDYTFAFGRVFYLYGPGEDPSRVIPAVARAMLAGKDFDASAGTQLRDYLHVDDVARGFAVLLERATTGTYNIASARPVPIAEIMTMVRQHAGTGAKINFGAVPPRAYDPPSIGGDNARLKALGWNPEVTLEQGLARVLDEMRAQAAVNP
ncbi:NAD-dependent epimerase/dehydratase family protein [Usitatibacter palustris]|uniref:CDP-abequose synthase n=1 Tax=Usitatibacter palustris TaxID=2732487 RepID=A0A6M4HBB8_9PROT|nr:NAD(P)-dependent oxidoreductase [Usitatibacter palustris]QJR16512.1 CDP-abequose synthase [Usitatibacter palustris]